MNFFGCFNMILSLSSLKYVTNWNVQAWDRVELGLRVLELGGASWSCCRPWAWTDGAQPLLDATLLSSCSLFAVISISQAQLNWLVTSCAESWVCYNLGVIFWASCSLTSLNRWIPQTALVSYWPLLSSTWYSPTPWAFSASICDSCLLGTLWLWSGDGNSLVRSYVHCH